MENVLQEVESSSGQLQPITMNIGKFLSILHAPVVISLVISCGSYCIYVYFLFYNIIFCRAFITWPVLP
jgi:hypothetical protein